MPSRFQRDTAVVPVEPDRYTATIDRGWWIQRGPNGGYVAALMLRAATETAGGDPSRRPRSLTVHFLRAPAEGAVGLATTVERVGRTLSTVSVRMVQAGRTMALALVALGESRSGGVAFSDVSLPEVAPPEAVPPRSDAPPIPMAERYDVRPALGGPPFGGAHREDGRDGGAVGGWIRLADPAPIDEHVVAALADAWPPAVFSRLESMVAVPTIDLTVHFRAEVPALADDSFCFVSFRTHVAAEGFLEEDGEIWAPDGTLLAQSRQLATFIPT